ncbi:MAG: hypothetical protein GF317_23410 [Candidatus Lokiarchaeota archaeon]|nr:hypothetical protein [Candidatus Lokiarchaeota archaeon]
MAENRISFEDFIDSKIFSDLDKLDSALLNLDKRIEKMKGDSTPLVEPEKFSEYQKEITKLKDKIQDVSDIEKERLKIEQQKAKINNKRIQAAEGYTRELEDQKQALSDINKQVKDSVKLDRSRVKATKDAKKAIETQTGSIDELAIVLSKNKRAYKELSAEQRDNAEIGGELLTVIQEQDEELKDLSKTLGENQRNVGNYKDDISEALGETQLFGGALGNLGNSFTQALKFAKIFGSGVKAALAATGIGLFVIAIASVLGYFKQTEEGARVLKVATAALGAIFGQLMKVFTTIGQFIVEKLTPAFNWLTGVIDKVTSLISDSDKEGKSFVQTIKDQVAAAKQLAELEDQYRKIRRESSLTVKELERELSIQQQIADDSTRSLDAQLQANKRVQKLEEQIADERVTNAAIELRIINQRIKLRKNENKDIRDLLDEQAEAQNALTDAEIEKTRVVADNAKQRREIERDQFELRLDFLIDTFDREKTILEKNINDNKRSVKERQKDLDKLTEISRKAFNDQIKLTENFTGQKIDFDSLVKESDASVIEQKVRSLKVDEITSQRIREIIQEQKILNQDLTDAENALTETRIENNAKLLESKQEQAEELAELEKEMLHEEYDAELEQTEKLIAEYEKRKQAQEAAAMANFELIQAISQDIVKIVGDTTKDTGEKFKEVSKLILTETLNFLEKYAIAAIAQATIGSAITPQSLATAGVAGAAQAAILIGVIKGAVAVAKNQIASFKEGQVDIEGAGTETSDSIPAFISKGESVIKAKSTKKMKNTLTAINNDSPKNELLTAFFSDIGIKGGVSSDVLDYSDKFDTLISQQKKLISIMQNSNNSNNFDTWQAGKMIKKMNQKVIERNKYYG